MNVNMYVMCWDYLKFCCNSMFFANCKLPKMHFWSEQKLKLLEDSMILALVKYILVYYYLIYTVLPSYYVEFCSQKMKNSKFV